MKKGDVHAAAIAAFMMLLVVVIGAILIYHFYISSNAPPNWFRDMIDKYKYGEAFDNLNKIQLEVNNLLGGCLSPVADQKAPDPTSIINEIEKQITNLPANAASMLNRFTALRAEALANAKFCEANIFFSQLKFDGSDEEGFKKNLMSAKQKFDDVVKTGTERFQAVVLAKEKIALIDKIKGCDFSEKEKDKCTPENTKNYCIWTGEKGVFAKPCRTTVCTKLNENLCNLIFQQTKLCYPTYETSWQGYISQKPVPGKFQSCNPCVEINSCEDYKNDRFSCRSDSCKKGLDCEFPEDMPGSDIVGSCRPKGTGILCSDFIKEEACNRANILKCIWTGQRCVSLID